MSHFGHGPESRDAKIKKDCLTFRINQYIVRFDVSMDDRVRVSMSQCAQNLVGNGPNSANHYRRRPLRVGDVRLKLHHKKSPT